MFTCVDWQTTLLMLMFQLVRRFVTVYSIKMTTIKTELHDLSKKKLRQNVSANLFEDDVIRRQLPTVWDDDDVIAADRCVLPWQRHGIQVNDDGWRRYNSDETWSFDNWRRCHWTTQQQPEWTKYKNTISMSFLTCFLVTRIPAYGIKIRIFSK